MISSASYWVLGIFFLFDAVADAAARAHELVNGSDMITIPNCRFRQGLHTYDLCPILRSGNVNPEIVDVTVPERTGGGGVSSAGSPTFVRRLYTIAFNHAPNAQMCDSDTWICMSETRGFENLQHEASTWETHTSIADSLLHAEISKPSTSNSELKTTDNPSIKLTFGGDSRQGEKQLASIEFICDVLSQMGRPSFAHGKLVEGVHSFTWVTKYACPVPDEDTSSLRSSAVTVLEDEDTTDQERPPMSDDSSGREDDGYELIKPKSPSRFSWIVFVLLFTGAFLFITTLLLPAAYPQWRIHCLAHLKMLIARLRLPTCYSFALSFILKPFHFQTGETRLVQWAQEDMELGVMENEFDKMVNNNPVRDEWAEGMEYIPLKANSMR
ncbi:hypothetical protein H0H92_002090, partial [Tricholoma furcatifolium]